MMNGMGYDAMVAGNHEPDFTAEKLRTRISEAQFPVHAANIKHRWYGQLFTTPYVIRTVNGVKIGILGLAYPNTLEQSIENFSTQDPTKKVGGMIQVSGLQFSYNPEAPFNQRVQTVTVGGKALAFTHYYSVATNALLAKGGHNFAPFKHGGDRREAGKQFEMVQSWIAAYGDITAPPTNRITKLGLIETRGVFISTWTRG